MVGPWQADQVMRIKVDEELVNKIQGLPKEKKVVRDYERLQFTYIYTLQDA